jgi:hypothetical protein
MQAMLILIDNSINLSFKRRVLTSGNIASNWRLQSSRFLSYSNTGPSTG